MAVPVLVIDLTDKLNTPKEKVRKILAMLTDEFTEIPTDGKKLPRLKCETRIKLFLDIEVQVMSEDGTEKCSVTFRMMKHNMYMIGFKSGKMGNFFWELRGSDGKFRKLIPGSKVLDLTDSYVGKNSIGLMADIIKKCRDASDPSKTVFLPVPYRDALVLNLENTTAHVLDLYYYKDGKDLKSLAKSLVYMVQFLGEMPRFTGIEKQVSDQWEKQEIPADEIYLEERVGNRATRLDAELVKKQREWSTISSEILERQVYDRANEVGVLLGVSQTSSSTSTSTSKKGKGKKK